jgi:pimeloyl-ACP methyl ester carboxylesterase
MARPILMPQVGQDLTEGKVVAIKVKVGDKVKKGDIVAEVESEKASFDVECFETGTIIEIRHKVGDSATVLQPLMMVGEAGEASAAAAPAAAAKAAAPVVAAAVVQVAPGAAAAGATASGRSSPLARRLANESGLDIRQIRGTGPGGAVVMKDVEAFRQTGQGAATVLSFPSAAPAAVGGGQGIKSLQQGVGDPVLFIHGFGADLSSWRPFVLQMKAGNPLLALDLPGHGISQDGSVTSFADLVAQVLRQIEAAGLTRLHLVGHSLGAAVATELAGGGSLDVRSLSLVSPAGLGPKVNGDFVDGFLAAQSEVPLKAWLDVLVHDPAKLPGALLRATLAGRDGTRLAAQQRKLADAVFAGSTQLFSIRDALQRYQGPVRVMVGDNDRIIPADYSNGLPAHVALHRLPQVGHLPQLEAAGLVARLVSETVRSAG